MPLIPSLAGAAHHVQAIAPYYQASRPASVVANPIILMFSIFGLLGGTVLAMEKIWRMGHLMVEDPQPWRHPATADRLMTISAALALVLYIGPDAVSFMAWPDVSPQTRYAIAIVNRLLDFVALAPMAAGWLLGIYAQPTLDYQLKREPIPIHLWLSWQQLRRPLWIGLLLLLLSMGLSLGR